MCAAQPEVIGAIAVDDSLYVLHGLLQHCEPSAWRVSRWREVITAINADGSPHLLHGLLKGTQPEVIRATNADGSPYLLHGLSQH